MKSRSARRIKSGKPVLSSIGLAVVATLITGGVQAGTSAVALTGTSVVSDQSSGMTDGVTTNGAQVIENKLFNQNYVSASIYSNRGSLNADGDQTGTSTTVSANQASAQAMGNNASGSIDSAARSTTTSNGLVVHSVSNNVGGTNSVAIGNSFTSYVDGPGTGATSASNGNLISASTTVNNTTASIAGVSRAGVGSSAPGSSTVDYTSAPDATKNLSATTADIDVATVQQASGWSEAVTAFNYISADRNSYDMSSGPVSANVEVKNNTISATLKGNAAVNAVSLQAGGAPTYTGSVAVTNLQSHGQQDPDMGRISGVALNVFTWVSGEVSSYSDVTSGSQSTLTVTGNALTSAATANQASNSIVLGNGLSFTGNGAPAGIVTASYSDSGADRVQAQVTADLLLLNNQNNVNAAVVSATFINEIDGSSYVPNGTSNLNVSGNSITSAVNGNVANSSITNGAAVAFTGTAALLNQQGNTNASVQAITDYSSVRANANSWGYDTASSSTVTVNTNVISTTAFGNQAAQSLALNATTLTPSAAAAVLTTQLGADVAASGFATVVNLQSNANSPVSAYTVESGINLSSYTDPASQRTLTLANNMQRAIAGGSTASNVLSLTGTTVGSGAGVLNVQTSDSTSPVVAGLNDVRVSLDSNGVTNSALAVTGNLQVAFAYGASASNTMSVAGNALMLPSSASGPIASDLNRYTGVPTVTAAYAILNSQSTNSNVTASTTAAVPDSFGWWGGWNNGNGEASIGARVNGGLSGSSLNNDSNALVAAAYGNDAISGLTLALGNVPAAGFVSVGNVTNVQSVEGAQILASATGGQIITTQVEGDLASSKVSTTGNTIEAIALGNRAANQVAMTGGNIDTSATSDAPRGRATTNGWAHTVDASFSVQNRQTLDQGTVTATQRMDSGPASSIGITLGTDMAELQIANSFVGADRNLSIASATANTATNAVALTVNTAATTSAVQNTQFVGDVSVSALVGQVDQSNAVANQGGVILAIAGSGASITNSVLSVSNNITTGSVTANAVTNSLSVAANNITNGSGNTGPVGQLWFDGTLVEADHAVTSRQESLATLSSDVVGSFGIDLSNKATISGSTLSVAGNVQTSSAVANTATNALSLGGAGTTGILSSSGLMALQRGSGSVTATSNLELFTPVGVSNSTVAITGNTNAALAVMNQATNTVAVAATNLASVSNDTNSNAMVNSGYWSRAAGDHVLGNQQLAFADVSSTAQTSLYNKEGEFNPDASLINGSLTVSGNTTVAQAYANTAVNTLSVAASATQGATAGLLNGQYNIGAVTASASTAGMITLTGTTDGAQVLNGSTVALVGNSTMAVAHGNAATNTMVMSAGSSYDTSSVAANSGMYAGSNTQATAALLNNQVNDGSVSATSSNTGYQVALNSVGVSNGAINVSGNTVAAAAYGNSANNSITLSALNSGSPTAALSSYQTNSGSVTATVSSTYYGSGITGGVTGSAVRVSGNQVTASAVGNSVSSSIVASR